MIGDVCKNITKLLNVRQGISETNCINESWFSTQIAKLDMHRDTEELHESLFVLMLVANANVDNAQRVSSLAAVQNENQADQELYNKDINKEI